MRRVLARVDDARLGRAVAGLVRQSLVVERVIRGESEVRSQVRSFGKRGVQVFSVAFARAGRGWQVFCSCRDFTERGLHCKHITAVALHELGAQSYARSERREVGLLVQR
jgi:uncharacterized Zn finger protein